MHRLAISHISALLNQTTSSSHHEYNQRDHIESTTHPYSNIDCHSATYQVINCPTWQTKKTAKWQTAMLEPTPASDLIDNLRKYVPELEYILEQSARKQQTPTHQTSAKPLEATNSNLLEVRNTLLQATHWPYISYTCAPPHKLTSSCLFPLWKPSYSEAVYFA